MSKGGRRSQATRISPDTAAPAPHAAGFDGQLLVCALIPMAAALLVYARCVQLGLVWDDPLVLRQIQYIRGVGDLLVPPEIVPRFYYRPFIFLTFLGDRWIGGDTPWMLHATVIAWHVLATGLVFVLARALLGRPATIEAGMAALLFAVHPIHTESVAWIAGRSDVIATAFVVLAILFGQARRAWTAWAAGFALLLACWSKEIGLAGLLLVPARDAFIDRAVRWKRYVPLVLAVGLYLVSRQYGLGTVATGSPVEAEPGTLIRDLSAAIGWYAAKIVLPFGLNAYVPAVPAGAFYPIVGVLTVIGVLLIGIRSWSVGAGVVTFLLLWWAVTLAPSLLVIARRSASAVLAERYLYLPSVAAVILVGWLVTRLRPTSTLAWRGALAVLLLLSLGGAIQSVKRTPVWADNLSFWTDVVANVPNQALPRRELADAYMAADQLDAAEQEYRAALALPSEREGRVMAYNGLGNLLVRQQKLEEAEAAYRDGLTLYPHPYLYSGLGRIAMWRAELAQQRGDQAEVVRQVKLARELLTNAVNADPQDFKSHALLGQVLLSLGEREAARQHLETAIQIQPTGPVADVSRRYLQQLGS